jgi:hypothetical protein
LQGFLLSFFGGRGIKIIERIYMQKQENLTLTICDKLVKIVHSIDTETGKLFKDQKNGLSELKELIEEKITKDQQYSGWETYNNFECSISWKVI